MSQDDNHPSKRRKVSKPKKGAPVFTDPVSQVTFLIGPDKTEFKIHKENVGHYSAVLKAAFENMSFIEGQTQTYKIEDTTEGAFRFFVQWIYGQNIRPRQLNDDNGQAEQLPSWKGVEDLDLVKVWVLGDKFLIPALQNCAIDQIVKINNKGNLGVPTHTFNYLYENSSVDSTIRKLAVVQSYYLHPVEFDKKPDRFPRELLVDLVSLASHIRFKDVKAPKPQLKATDYYV